MEGLYTRSYTAPADPATIKTGGVEVRGKGNTSMAKTSAGLLAYRRRFGAVQVFLVHPGGPFWAKKDLGAWSIPKGEYSSGEDPLAVAKREFEEELGRALPQGEFVSLGELVQPSRKLITAF